MRPRRARTADVFEFYLRHTPISPRPSRTTLHAARQGRGTSLERILFLVLSSCSLPERVQQLSRTWCGLHHPGVRCWFYLDCERLPVQTSPPAGLISLVPASAYMKDAAQYGPRSRCCDPDVDLEDANNTWDGVGPSSTYCVSHRSHTLKAPPSAPLPRARPDSYPTRRTLCVLSLRNRRGRRRRRRNTASSRRSRTRGPSAAPTSAPASSTGSCSSTTIRSSRRRDSPRSSVGSITGCRSSSASSSAPRRSTSRKHPLEESSLYARYRILLGGSLPRRVSLPVCFAAQVSVAPRCLLEAVMRRRRGAALAQGRRDARSNMTKVG